MNLCKSHIIKGLLTCTLSATLALPCWAQDISVSMDASGSIGHDGWEKEKQFALDLVESFRNVPNTRFNIIQFASDAQNIHHFSDSQEIDDIKLSISSMEYSQGKTATRSTMQQAINNFLYESDDDKDKLSVLITDGNPYPAIEQDPCDQREALQASSISSLILGVGGSWQAAKVECLVEDPQRHVLTLNTFDDLTKSVPLISSMMATFSSDPNDTLALYLPFENTENPAQDAARSLSNTIKGDIYLQDNGVNGSAVQFDGTHEKITIEDPFKTIEVTGELTLAFWLNLQDWPTGNEIIGRFGDDTKQGTLALMLGHEGDIVFYLHNKHIIPKQKLTLHEWSHLALSYHEDKNQIRLYLNGELIMADAFSIGTKTSFAVNQPISLGKGRWNTSRYFNGQFDEFKLFNKALSETEIQTEFDAALF